MPENLKKIYIANDNMEANLIKDVLGQNEIFCFIQGYEHRSMLGMLGSYVELGIMVPEGNSAEATKIIEETLNSVQVLPPDFTDEDEDQEDFILSPKKLRPKSRRVAIFLPFALPGAGSCYAGNSDLGSWIMVSYFVCIATLYLAIGVNTPSMWLPFITLFIVLLGTLDIIVALKTLNSDTKNNKK